MRITRHGYRPIGTSRPRVTLSAQATAPPGATGIAKPRPDRAHDAPSDRPPAVWQPDEQRVDDRLDAGLHRILPTKAARRRAASSGVALDEGEVRLLTPQASARSASFQPTRMRVVRMKAPAPGRGRDDKSHLACVREVALRPRPGLARDGLAGGVARRRCSVVRNVPAATNCARNLDVSCGGEVQGLQRLQVANNVAPADHPPCRSADRLAVLLLLKRDEQAELVIRHFRQYRPRLAASQAPGPSSCDNINGAMRRHSIPADPFAEVFSHAVIRRLVDQPHPSPDLQDQWTS